MEMWTKLKCMNTKQLFWLNFIIIFGILREKGYCRQMLSLIGSIKLITNSKFVKENFICHLYPTLTDFQKIFLSSRIGHLNFILKGQGFRGGSDEKMRRMWLGLGIAVVGLPPLVMPSLQGLCIIIFNLIHAFLNYFFSLIEGDPPNQINVTNA